MNITPTPIKFKRIRLIIKPIIKYIHKLIYKVPTKSNWTYFAPITRIGAYFDKLFSIRDVIKA